MQQADRMKKRHKKAMKDRGVGEGAVVTIKNDYRDISHPLGTVGVVIEAKESGGVRVCTEWGVIVQGGKLAKEYWIPHDRYVVNAKKDGRRFCWMYWRKFVKTLSVESLTKKISTK